MSKRCGTRPRCDWHLPDNLAYMTAHHQAEVRIKNGEKQKYCKACMHYYWPHEWGKPAPSATNGGDGDA